METGGSNPCCCVVCCSRKSHLFGISAELQLRYPGEKDLNVLRRRTKQNSEQIKVAVVPALCYIYVPFLLLQSYIHVYYVDGDDHRLNAPIKTR